MHDFYLNFPINHLNVLDCKPPLSDIYGTSVYNSLFNKMGNMLFFPHFGLIFHSVFELYSTIAFRKPVKPNCTVPLHRHIHSRNRTTGPALLSL